MKKPKKIRRQALRATVVMGPDGVSVRLRLDDGSRLRLQPDLVAHLLNSTMDMYARLAADRGVESPHAN